MYHLRLVHAGYLTLTSDAVEDGVDVLSLTVESSRGVGYCYELACVVCCPVFDRTHGSGQRSGFLPCLSLVVCYLSRLYCWRSSSAIHIQQQLVN